MAFVIIDNETGHYVATDSHPHTFTPEIKRAKLYRSEAAAQADCARGEMVMELATLALAAAVGEIYKDA